MFHHSHLHDALGTAAFNLCKNAKSQEGVHSAKFYWPNPNIIAIIIEAETGSWGMQKEPDGSTMKAFFDLSDVAKCVMDETYSDEEIKKFYENEVI